MYNYDENKVNNLLDELEVIGNRIKETCKHITTTLSDKRLNNVPK